MMVLFIFSTEHTIAKAVGHEHFTFKTLQLKKQEKPNNSWKPEHEMSTSVDLYCMNERRYLGKFILRAPPALMGVRVMVPLVLGLPVSN